MPYCQTCGGEHAASDSFCAGCGSKVGSAAVAAPVEAQGIPTPAPAYVAPAYVAPAPVYAAAPAKPKGGAGVLAGVLVGLLVVLYFGPLPMYEAGWWDIARAVEIILSIAIVVVATMAIIRCKAAWCVDYRKAFKQYATFSGRADLHEFWSFAIVNFVLYLIMALPVIDRYLGTYVLGWLYNLSFAYPLYSLAVLLPSIAITVRRLHDTGRSGGWYFISLVPAVGSIILLVFLLQNSNGENQYSPGARPAYVAAQAIPAGWLADPTGRHELRYWDSRAWTGHVSDVGVTSSDPL
ncbi:MAG: hypothetical protein CVT66_07965 [Actinobacteria bacterium HGW-Actinobacteria-6]|nr:MAG: hypothetical protein CVT66_07965 [Actinobacteria bacterium HGW-Actinobacteria-6]